MQAGPVPNRHADVRLSEAELVAQARSGNEEAVRALVQRNNQQLFRVARGLLDNDTDAEDAVQSAYLQVFNKITYKSKVLMTSINYIYFLSTSGISIVPSSF